jgi:hypothetical protein
VPSAKANSLIANKQITNNVIANKQKANKPPPNMNQRERNKQADLELLRQFVALVKNLLLFCFILFCVVLAVFEIFKSF